MITNEQYKESLSIVSEFRTQKNLPVVDDNVRFFCSCGCHYFTYVNPNSIPIKERKHGTKHWYTCDNCSKQYWSFFYRLDTENYIK